MGACVGSAFLGLVSLGVAAPAHAALIHNFIDTGAGNAVIGQIQFSAATPGTVTAFSLDTTGLGGPNLGLANLCGPGGGALCAVPSFTTTWVIDGAWNINGFILSFDLLDFFGPSVDIEQINIEFLDPAAAGADTVSVLASMLNCAIFAPCADLAVGLVSRLATEAVHVPEPATFLLFTAGLVLLAGIARRRTHKSLA